MHVHVHVHVHVCVIVLIVTLEVFVQISYYNIWVVGYDELLLMSQCMCSFVLCAAGRTVHGSHSSIQPVGVSVGEDLSWSAICRI